MSKHLQKLFALVLVCCAFLGSSTAWGQVLYEPFPTTGSLTTMAGWANNSGTAGQLQVVADNLSFSGLPASEGNKVTIKASDSEDARYDLGDKSVTSGSIYASFLMKPSGAFLGNTTVGNYFFHFIGNTATTFISRVSVRAGSAANTFNIGLINYSGGTILPEAVYGSTPTDYALNETYFVVIKYDMATNTSSIWVNPVPGSEEVDATLINTLNDPSATTLSGVGIRQSNSKGEGTGNIDIDEIRVGTTWASVTPSGTPTTTPTITPSTGSINLGEKLIGATAEGKYTLSAENIPADQNIVLTTSGPFKISTSETGPFTTTLTLTAAELATKVIRVNAIPETIGEITGEIIHSTAGATDAKVGLVVYGASPFVQEFNRCSDTLPGGWTQYSVTGDQTWDCTTYGQQGNGVQMSGYSGGNNENSDWLISPALDLSGFNIPLLSINYRTKFAGEGLKVKVSTDYTGAGDPNAATWTELIVLPADEADVWKLLENIDLQNYKTASTYIAFEYKSSTTDGAPRWTLDNFEVKDVQNYLNTSNLNLNFAETAQGSTSAAQEFTFSAGGFADNVVVAAPANFELSTDGTTYTSSLTYTAEEAAASNKVYVRFAPATTSFISSGPVTFTSGETVITRGMLTGSSMLKANTLEVVTWNMEWFGATGTGPSDEDLQYENAKKVITELNADIIGVQEVVDEAKISQLAAETGYTYTSETMPWQAANEQKVGFLYKTSTVTLKKEKVLLSKLFADIKAGTKDLTDYPTGDELFWASGRLPYLAVFEANINGVKQTLHVVNLHAKANSESSDLDYQRRQYDAKVLSDSLAAQYGNANLILLGDFNDDVDVSVVGTNQKSSFDVFVANEANYTTLTMDLSLAGKNTYESGALKSFLDHIFISNELTDEYVASSIAIEETLLNMIANYRTTTSDHLPVSARFMLTADPAAPATVSFTTASVSKTEDAGKFNVSLTLSEGVATEQTVTITPAASSTATAADYTITGATNGAVTVTIPANATTATFEVSITDDTETEAAEQVVFEMSNPSSGITLGTAKTFTLTIEANDAPTGIADGTKGQFNVYPTVVNGGNVRLLLPERVAATAKVNMVVYSAEGRKVLTTTGTQTAAQTMLNSKVAGLPAGIYMILIETGKEYFQTKMVKN